MAPATKGGMHFLARRAVVWFSDGRKPGCKGFIQNWRLLSIKRRRTSQRSGTIYLPRAEPSTRPGGVSRSRTEPLAPRAVRPGGAINPRPQGVNLREYSFPPFPPQKPIISNDTHSKKALTITVSAFSVNQQLPILPGRFQPSTFGVCELNYRVRHGYGCILTAIATESLRVCSLKTA